MAPLDDTKFYSSQVLIARKPRNYYLTSIKPIHWQLRSIIGVSEAGTVYYPAGPTNQHLQELDPTTRKSETVAYLEFSPRCLVATKGWVCCGGELGEFVAIRTSKHADHSPRGGRSSPDSGHSNSRRRGQPGGNDDLEYAEFDFDTRMCDAPLVTVPPRMTARSGKFGKERVNCVTVWTPSDIVPLQRGAYPFPVAALSNNDKTVTLVKLETAEPLDSLDFPDCVNRSVLAPDGRILVSVSDDVYLYVHGRVRKVGEPIWQHRDSSTDQFLPSVWEAYEWKLLAKHHLRGQSKADKSVHRGSFAACFSNTGRYLAIGTQYGIISVYDATQLTDPNTSPIACFSSSSPNTDNGAVREMTFCPGPYDLLAWSEDHGAAGVADIRDGFVSRQILSLTEDANYTKFHVQQTIRVNGELEERRQRRLAAGEIGNEQELRVRDAFERYNSPFSTDESQVRQLLAPAHRRRELREMSRDLDRERAQTNLGRRSVILRSSRPSRIPAAPSTAAPSTAPAPTASADASATGTTSSTSANANANANANSNGSASYRPTSGDGRVRDVRERSEMDTAMNDILGTFRSRLRDRDYGEAELLSSGTVGLLLAARRAAIPTIENEESTGASAGADAGAGAGAGAGGDRDDYNEYSSFFGARTEQMRQRIRTMQQQQQQPLFPWDPAPSEANAANSRAREEMGAFGSNSRYGDPLHTYTTDAPTGRVGPIRTAQRHARERQLLLESVALDTPEAQLLQSGLLGWDNVGSGMALRRAGELVPDPPKAGFTAGMSWSDDGRILFVGTQEGIFEFRVDLRARMYHPERAMR